MIFKVSFKETGKKPSKVITKYGSLTEVTLKGTVALPPFWHHIPEDIMEWLRNSKKVELYVDVSRNILYVFSAGKSRCREDDKYDSLLGERLAEARAKYCIYKVFYDLCSKLEEYYNKLLFGPYGVVDSGSGSCIARDLKKYEGLCIREAHHIGELLASKENG
jgi:hypothetical protein